MFGGAADTIIVNIVPFWAARFPVIFHAFDTSICATGNETKILEFIFEMHTKSALVEQWYMLLLEPYSQMEQC